MKGKTVFIGGVADSTGYGWAIAKACAEAGAKVLLGTWPPVLPMFQMGIERGQFDEDTKLSDGTTLTISKVQMNPIVLYILLLIRYLFFLLFVCDVMVRFILWMLPSTLKN